MHLLRVKFVRLRKGLKQSLLQIRGQLLVDILRPYPIQYKQGQPIPLTVWAMQCQLPQRSFSRITANNHIRVEFANYCEAEYADLDNSTRESTHKCTALSPFGIDSTFCFLGKIAY